MSELKTQRNTKSVARFIDSVSDAGRREDAHKVLALMEEVTGEKAEMWGESIVGFGIYRYRYPNGCEMEWMRVGFSPRRAYLVLYILSGFSMYEELMSRLGKHKTGKGCLYLKRFDDVDAKVLRELIRESLTFLKQREKERSHAESSATAPRSAKSAATKKVGKAAKSATATKVGKAAKSAAAAKVGKAAKSAKAVKPGKAAKSAKAAKPRRTEKSPRS